ncbi:MAG: peptidoglycan DD-metalloendopeptidase family protein, partial [Candidatus Gracilibacteria bacterium]|nr:peptidoglycan DD-metalloendopeptidase family protein [Candidatus Gracilibacteria bacterium]
LGTPVMALANGVITKVVNTENADGKYVIIRHDSVSYDGRVVASYYSSYLHLEIASVTEGNVIKKGDILGKVGMTGITTTPHLHFQIDTSDAPFHSYWPYSFQDLRNLKIDFFEAVNLGLGKENAMKYTVNPMDFVQKLTDSSFSVQAPVTSEIKVAATMPDAPQNFVTSVPVVVPKPSVSVPTPVVNELMSAPELPGPIAPSIVIAPPVAVKPSSATVAAQSVQAFTDIPKLAIYSKAAQYLKAKAIPVLQNETIFRPNQTMTRREAVLYLAGVFSIAQQEGATATFADIPADDVAVGYIASFKARGIITGGWLFRPNDAVTKTELTAMMLRITADYQTAYNVYGENGAIKKFVADTKFKKAGIQPQRAVTRADGARMIQAWGVLKGG